MSVMAAKQHAPASLPLNGSKNSRPPVGVEKKETSQGPSWLNARQTLRPVAPRVTPHSAPNEASNVLNSEEATENVARGAKGEAAKGAEAFLSVESPKDESSKTAVEKRSVTTLPNVQDDVSEKNPPSIDLKKLPRPVPALPPKPRLGPDTNKKLSAESTGSNKDTLDSKSEKGAGVLAATSNLSLKTKTSAPSIPPRVSPRSVVSGRDTIGDKDGDAIEVERSSEQFSKLDVSDSTSFSSGQSKQPVVGAFPSVKERAQIFTKSNSQNSVSMGAVVKQVREGDMSRKQEKSKATENRINGDNASISNGSIRGNKSPATSPRDLLNKSGESDKSESFVTIMARTFDTQQQQQSSDDGPRVSPPSPVRSPGSNRGTAFFGVSGSPSPLLFPRQEMKVYSTTPLAPFSATSKPPPDRYTEAPLASTARSQAPPPIPPSRPQSVSLGPSAVPLPSETIDAKAAPPVVPKRPLSLQRRESGGSPNAKKKVPSPQNVSGNSLRSRSSTSSSESNDSSRVKSVQEAKATQPTLGDTGSVSSIDDDFDDYEGVEVPYDDSAPVVPTGPSGRDTPPPPVPKPSGRLTPPPVPPVESDDQKSESGEASEVSWSDDYDSSDNEDDDIRGGKRLAVAHSIHVYQPDHGSDVAHMLAGARLRTTTFPVSEGLVEFDTTLSKKGSSEVTPTKEPPPLPQRPSKATPTPLPPKPASSTTRPPSSTDGRSSPDKDSSANRLSHESSQTLRQSHMSRASTSSSLAPEHRAFLVDRLGYSPDRLIQLAPLGPQDSGQTTPNANNRLVRWKGALRRQQTVISTRAASALSVVMETFTFAMSRSLLVRDSVPRSLVSSLSRRMKTPRSLPVAVPVFRRFRRGSQTSQTSSSQTSMTSHTLAKQGKGKRRSILETRIVFRNRGRGFSGQEQSRKPQDVFAVMAGEQEVLEKSATSTISTLPHAKAQQRNLSSVRDLNTSRGSLFSQSDGSRSNLSFDSDDDVYARPIQGINEEASGIRWSKLDHGDEWL